MKYCKSCGKEVADDAKFCKHCGQDLTDSMDLDRLGSLNESENSSNKEVDPDQPLDQPESTQEDTDGVSSIKGSDTKSGGLGKTFNRSKQPKQPKEGGLTASAPTGGQRQRLSRKSKIFLSIAGLLVILLIVAYQVGASMTSKEKIIEKFESAMVKKDTQTVADMLEVNGSGLTINNKTVKGFVDYFAENPSDMQELMDHLNSQAKEYEKNTDVAEAMADAQLYYAVNLVKDGKTFVYDNFDIMVSPVYFNVQTNYEDTEISINGKVIATSKSEDFSKEVGPFLPGTYTFKAKYKGDYVELKTESENTNFDPGYTEEVHLNIEGEEVSFDLPFYDLDSVKLYLNGEDTGINLLETDTVGPVLTDGSMTASFEAEFPWGKIKTKEVPIDSNYMDANFAASEELKQTLQDTIVKFNKELLVAKTTADAGKFTVAGEEIVKNVIDDAEYDKEYDYYYKGKFIGVDFAGDSFTIENNGENWVITVNAITHFEEDSYYGDDKPELEETSEDYGYELTYDEGNQKWLVTYIGWAGSMDEDNMIEYRVKEPKAVTSAWAKK